MTALSKRRPLTGVILFFLNVRVGSQLPERPSPGCQALWLSVVPTYVGNMSENTSNPDDLTNGAGEADTSSDAPDVTSGGSPDGTSVRPPNTEQPDGAPTENPSGG